MESWERSGWRLEDEVEKKWEEAVYHVKKKPRKDKSGEKIEGGECASTLLTPTFLSTLPKTKENAWVEESFTNFQKGINWRSYVVCDVAYNNVNNWLWTPFIDRGVANRIYIEIKFTIRDCSLFPGMLLLFNSLPIIDLVYYITCPEVTINFAHFPVTPTGKEVTLIEQATGKCVKNAEVVEPPTYLCKGDGKWTLPTGACKCKAGFEPDFEKQTCNVCPSGKFKSEVGDNLCQPCPEHSKAPSSGFSECTCDNDYYRAPSDPKNMSCTQPPSAPQNLSLNFVDQSTVMLSWTLPDRLGGRIDTVYRIKCDACTAGIVQYTPNAEIFNDTKVTITGLNAVTTYRFQVFAENGVSHLSTKTNPEYADLTVTTEASIVSSITNVRITSVKSSEITLIWEAPVVDGDVENEIETYEVRCFPRGDMDYSNSSSILTKDLTATFTGLMQRTEYGLQVRAKTYVGDDDGFRLQLVAGGIVAIVVVIAAAIVLTVVFLKSRSNDECNKKQPSDCDTLEYRNGEVHHNLDNPPIVATHTNGEFLHDYQVSDQEDFRRQPPFNPYFWHTRNHLTDRSDDLHLSDASIFQNPAAHAFTNSLRRDVHPNQRSPNRFEWGFANQANFDSSCGPSEDEVRRRFSSLLNLTRGNQFLNDLDECSEGRDENWARNNFEMERTSPENQLNENDTIYKCINSYSDLIYDNRENLEDPDCSYGFLRGVVGPRIPNESFNNESDPVNCGDFERNDVNSDRWQMNEGLNLNRWSPPRDTNHRFRSTDTWVTFQNANPKSKSGNYRSTNPLAADAPDLTNFTSVEEWLNSIKMARYLENFHAGGINTMDAVVNLTVKELTELGITLVGHQKKIMNSVQNIRAQIRVNGSEGFLV
ncbi:eph receptor a5 [Holotrichia oblita]|uniref:Eph receptor a5 n=1 Tax=Holotrichia oblita TaxID=644536 RepID=A0ACB9SHU1_HOLOL|nr:eph receptor a5 [Holotrichia oblita]